MIFQGEVGMVEQQQKRYNNAKNIKTFFGFEHLQRPFLITIPAAATFC